MRPSTINRFYNLREEYPDYSDSMIYELILQGLCNDLDSTTDHEDEYSLMRQIHEIEEEIKELRSEEHKRFENLAKDRNKTL